MTKKDLSVIEIYPKIFVYKNLFKDINKTYTALKEYSGEEDGLFSPWTQWSHFGEYLNPTFKDIPHQFNIEDVKKLKTETEKQETHKTVILELLENFNIATKDYIERNNIDFDSDKAIVNKNGEEVKEWKITGPSIARYRVDIDDSIAMTYHSDYIREPIVSPGYKFAITALAYFNDDYEGGEIDFIVNKEAIMYKPEAGDYLVFPSGHPDVLTNNGSVYIHGVLPPKKANKYLSRMYWMKYSLGDDKWFEKEKEFGKDIWNEMQNDIMQKFRDENPNRMNAEGTIRIK